MQRAQEKEESRTSRTEVRITHGFDLKPKWRAIQPVWVGRVLEIPPEGGDSRAGSN